MKLTYITIIILFFLTNCSPVYKQHGYQVEDILSKTPPEIGVDTKQDIIDFYGTPSIKIEDVDNTWLYIVSQKEKKVFARDEFKELLVFAFNFDKNDILLSSSIYDQSNMLEIEKDLSTTTNEKSNYTVLDQIYDAFTRGL